MLRGKSGNLERKKKNQRGKTESEQECDSRHAPIGCSFISL